MLPAELNESLRPLKGQLLDLLDKIVSDAVAAVQAYIRATVKGVSVTETVMGPGEHTATLRFGTGKDAVAFYDMVSRFLNLPPESVADVLSGCDHLKAVPASDWKGWTASPMPPASGGSAVPDDATGSRAVADAFAQAATLAKGVVLSALQGENRDRAHVVFDFATIEDATRFLTPAACVVPPTANGADLFATLFYAPSGG